MKNSLRLFCLVAVLILLGVSVISPHDGKPLSHLLTLGEMSPFAALSFPGQTSAKPHRHEGGAESIWLVCEARGKTDPRLVPTDVPTDAQLDVMRNLMSSHHHRVAHALWHAMRGGVTPQQEQAIQSAYGAAWKSPHHQCPLPRNTVTGDDNPYGEDFLYMHRQMVNELQGALIRENLPCIGPWASIPASDDARWPVPDAYAGGVKSDDALRTMQAWERYFEDSSWLKRHSLAQVGFYVEVTIHNNMHMRWATIDPPPGFYDGANLPIDNQFPSDWPYDAPAYDWLADPYGSHVNKHFWKLHGLVDRILDRWLEANGYLTASEDCHGDAKCYQWRGTWVGEVSHERLEAEEAATPGGKTLPFASFKRGELTEEQLRHADRADDDPESYVRRNFCRNQ